MDARTREIKLENKLLKIKLEDVESHIKNMTARHLEKFLEYEMLLQEKDTKIAETEKRLEMMSRTAKDIYRRLKAMTSLITTRSGT
jgi:hypothetical protein